MTNEALQAAKRILQDDDIAVRETDATLVARELLASIEARRNAESALTECSKSLNIYKRGFEAWKQKYEKVEERITELEEYDKVRENLIGALHELEDGLKADITALRKVLEAGLPSDRSFDQGWEVMAREVLDKAVQG